MNPERKKSGVCFARLQFRVRWFLFVALAIISILGYGCTSTKKQTKHVMVKVVSWGGKFQAGLVSQWLMPVASKEGIDLEAEAWDGDYGALTARIEKGICTWDLIHVEDHYVRNSKASSLFFSQNDRDLPYLNSQLTFPYAVPVLQYGYVLAYRQDQLQLNKKPNWREFWDTDSIPGTRGVRDFPIGNIEIALLSIGMDLDRDLYNSDLSLSQLEENINLAFRQFDKIKDDLVWWKTGDQLQRGMTSGEMQMCAAWSGRVLSAHKDLCGESHPESCKLQVNEESALISTDWWIIPKDGANAEAANRLMNALYSSRVALIGAAHFSESHGYKVPCDSLPVENALASFYLDLGSSQNRKMITLIDNAFWSKNFSWIYDRWTSWRTRY